MSARPGAPAPLPPAAPPGAHRPTAALVIALLVIGLLAGGWMLGKAKIPAAALAPARWADGEAGRAINEALKLPVQAQADLATAALRYRLLGDLGPQVALGCRTGCSTATGCARRRVRASRCCSNACG